MAKFKVSMQTPGKSHANDYFDLEMTGSEADDVKLQICNAGAKVLVRRLREHLEETTKDPNKDIRGMLAKSLSIQEGKSSVFVSPKGKHHDTAAGIKAKAAKSDHRPKTGQGTSHLRKHHGMTYAVSASDVGYYLEYGTPRMPAEHWMETTLEQAEEEIVAAMEVEWNAYLDSKGV